MTELTHAPNYHPNCISEDPDLPGHDAFAAEYCTPVSAVVEALPTIDLTANGGLDEICDLALDLLDFIREQPSPALRYAAMRGVIYHLVEALAPEPVE
jgi:hypothetical protein